MPTVAFSSVKPHHWLYIKIDSLGGGKASLLMSAPYDGCALLKYKNGCCDTHLWLGGPPLWDTAPPPTSVSSGSPACCSPAAVRSPAWSRLCTESLRRKRSHSPRLRWTFPTWKQTGVNFTSSGLVLHLTAALLAVDGAVLWFYEVSHHCFFSGMIAVQLGSFCP